MMLAKENEKSPLKDAEAKAETAENIRRRKASVRRTLNKAKLKIKDALD